MTNNCYLAVGNCVGFRSEREHKSSLFNYNNFSLGLIFFNPIFAAVFFAERLILQEFFYLTFIRSFKRKCKTEIAGVKNGVKKILKLRLIMAVDIFLMEVNRF